MIILLYFSVLIAGCTVKSVPVPPVVNMLCYLRISLGSDLSEKMWKQYISVIHTTMTQTWRLVHTFIFLSYCSQYISVIHTTKTQSWHLMPVFIFFLSYWSQYISVIHTTITQSFHLVYMFIFLSYRSYLMKESLYYLKLEDMFLLVKLIFVKKIIFILFKFSMIADQNYLIFYYIF